MLGASDGAVVVTGLGAASALGTGIAAHLSALEAGRDGARHREDQLWRELEVRTRAR